MIFIGTIKGVMWAIVITLCLVIALKIFVRRFRFDDEVSFLLMVSFGVSVVLMSIYSWVDSSESKILYAQNQIHQALSQSHDGSIKGSIASYIDENFPEISTSQNAQLTKSEITSKVDERTNSVVWWLRFVKFITLLIEIIIQALIFVFIKNKFKGSQGGYGRGASYMSGGYYE